MIKILPIVTCCFFVSCSAKIYYVGQQHNPSKKVDVFVTESSIQKKYIIVGQGYLNLWAAHLKPFKIEALAEKKATEKGADAILISDFYIPHSGQSIHTVYRTDTIQNALVSTESTTITPTSTAGYRIYFMKYLN
ncbi:MAG: hypothetical protein RL115_2277 [Bacteroidota bacterium]|jgi:hypothetical protein